MIGRIRKRAMCMTRTIHSYHSRESKMTKKSIKWLVFFLRVFRCLKSPLTRFRKLMRKSNTKQLKVAVGALLISSCFIALLCYWYRSSSTPRQHHTLRHRLKTTSKEKYVKGTQLSHVNLSEFYRDSKETDSYELDIFKTVRILDTPGCKIPLQITSNLINYKPIKRNVSCGKRVVFLKKIDTDKIQILIKPRIMKNYLRKSMRFDCCYRFLLTSQKHSRIRFTSCKNIYNGETFVLESDFVNIRCFEYDSKNVSYNIYDDVYPFTKKINIIKPKKSVHCKNKYNILMIGINSMSLSRFERTMPRTTVFLKENYWYAFRAYHKVADNTFLNLMATLTGKDFTKIRNDCSKDMDRCRDLLIWSKFKQAGYVTAYGEDFLRMPNSFSNAFHQPPTDHYIRPILVKRETEMFNRSIVCTGKLPSGQQLLNYALDFVNTYRMESFFGLFWIKSFSYNEENQPQDGDEILENFLNQLSYTGVLYNTFIVVFSDHGINLGRDRLEVAGYYDERLPCLFLWLPLVFKGHHAAKSFSVQVNQFRLVTPYDLYNTLMDINRISTCNTSNLTEVASEACPNCQSIFNVISGNRTCQNASIKEEWCSCHNLYPLLKQDSEGLKAVTFVKTSIQTMIQLITTKRCWVCSKSLLETIIRNSFYYEIGQSTVYYVIAFTMTPSNMSYEATVKRKGGKMELIGQFSVISSYRSFGNCTIKPRDRLFCVCEKIKKCS